MPEKTVLILKIAGEGGAGGKCVKPMDTVNPVTIQVSILALAASKLRTCGPPL